MEWFFPKSASTVTSSQPSASDATASHHVAKQHGIVSLMEKLQSPAQELEQVEQKKEEQIDVRSFLLVGERHAGKSSLLYQYALNRAMEKKDGIVVYIALKEKIHAQRMMLVSSSMVEHLSEESNQRSVLEKIHMKYCSDYEQLKEYLAFVHMSQILIHTIIVDDLDVISKPRVVEDQISAHSLTPHEERMDALSMQAHVMALLQDACHGLKNKFRVPVQYGASMKSSSNSPCPSLRAGPFFRNTYIIKSIGPAPSPDSNDRQFELSSNNTNTSFKFTMCPDANCIFLM